MYCRLVLEGVNEGVRTTRRVRGGPCGTFRHDTPAAFRQGRKPAILFILLKKGPTGVAGGSSYAPKRLSYQLRPNRRLSVWHLHAVPATRKRVPSAHMPRLSREPTPLPAQLRAYAPLLHHPSFRHQRLLPASFLVGSAIRIPASTLLGTGCRNAIGRSHFCNLRPTAIV